MDVTSSVQGPKATSLSVVRRTGAPQSPDVDRGRTSFTEAVLNNPLWIFGLLRSVLPVLRIPLLGWYVITRFAHVKEVLDADQTFLVPWSGKMRELNDESCLPLPHGVERERLAPANPLENGINVFVLGTDNHEAHRRALRQLMKAFRKEDADQVATMAERLSEDIIANYRERIRVKGFQAPFDVIQDLVTLVPTRLCRRYFGLDIAPSEEITFARCAIAMSIYLFGDPADVPANRERAIAAAQWMRELIDRSIASARIPGADTVMRRLIRMQDQELQESGGSAADIEITSSVIRGHMLGMVTGFVPTNTMAGGHIVDALLGGGWFLSWRRSKFSKPTLDALRRGDSEEFTRCILETLRFQPINPGVFRVTKEEYTLQNAGLFGHGTKTIPAGAKVLASTQSAMFDHRQVKGSYSFDTSRSSSDYMLFGSGMHVCLGLFLAKAQIGSTLKVLLRQPHLRRASGEGGCLKHYGPFPAHLHVTLGN